MKLAIVGAGFAGLLTAKRLSERGFKVDLFEEHDEVGVPEHCTGIVSRRAVELIGSEAKENVEGYVSEYFLSNSDFHGIWLKGPKDFTVKLRRRDLERDLLESSLANGVSFIKKTVFRVDPKGKVDERVYERVFVAEGWRAELSKGLGIAHRSRTVYGLNLEVKGRTAYPGTSFIIFDRTLAPGFFAWIVMLEGKAVVGTASEPKKANVMELARKVLEIARERGLVEGEVVKTYGGVILTGPPSLAPCNSKVCAIGDAAGLNKPLTGGGLYPTSVVARELPLRIENPIRAYFPLVPRLYAETPIARFLHKAPQRFYANFFSKVDGEEVSVSEYDNHLKTLLEMKSKSLVFLLKAVSALI
ncbi:hypothetical protein EYM_06170 [Ignicoccus islandicus DSM 13165]|uniref:Dehydrogenase n=1 Tax=Ignicoccus islandicus DSM 13165 TaxID=940295 RepID=A0A0U3FLG6_9CREN|nr:NAD(P)/FAD-dependent oxidoreductase [Ignicoccus islandicus]ALU12662.1 hypothetical protein EYM_06170 [Ignicoccus islandicus DSM 13165]